VLAGPSLAAFHFLIEGSRGCIHTSHHSASHGLSYRCLILTLAAYMKSVRLHVLIDHRSSIHPTTDTVPKTVPLALPMPMSSTPSPPPITLSAFHLKFSEAVRAYNKRTKNDLLFHPLAPVFQSCNDPAVALSVLQRTAQLSHRPGVSYEYLKSLLSPTLIGLYAISSSVEEGVGLVIVDSCSFRTCTLIKFFYSGIITREIHFGCNRCPPFGEDVP
jgi:hypothetical protein